MAIDKSIFDLIKQDKPADLKDIITKELKDRIEKEIENYRKNEFPNIIMKSKSTKQESKIEDKPEDNTEDK